MAAAARLRVMSQARIIEIPLANLQAVLRGEARMLNFPADGELVGFVGDGAQVRLLMRVHSKSYDPVPAGAQLGIYPAVVTARKRLTLGRKAAAR
jgi:hypothetical protein